MSTYEISKSSLLSLKAEILKKQDEVNKSKLENRNRVQTVKAKPLEIKNKGLENRLQNDLSEEDENLLKKSRSVLEAKARLYDKLSSGSTLDDEMQRKYLVHFNKKLSDVCPTEFDNDEDDKRVESEDDDPINYDDYKAENSEEEWVEYTDCLGRTRTCLRKDLKHIKEKDYSLRSSVDSHVNETVEVKEPVREEVSEDSEMLSSDMRRDMLRRKWEKEEEELRNKSDLHYQDILFGEARSHGVGYYGFSKDEEERATQQNALKNLRKETIEQQKLAQEMKRNRDRQLAARIRTAKNRKRARLGLPLLTSDDEDEKIVEPEPEKTEPEQTPEEKLKTKTDEIKRKMHVRPWDLGKEGVKEHYEMSQEEWVRLQRNKREGEFAPPRAYRSTTQKNLSTSDDENKGLYFTSSKKKIDVDVSKPPPDVRNPAKKKHLNPYKTREVVETLQNETFVPDAMQDECADDDNDRLLQDFHQIQSERVGVEIAPPPTYDYYGPSGSGKRNKSEQSGMNMADSIMEGLKFLRDKVEKKRKH